MKDVRIGDTVYESARVASLWLGIPYATMISKLREAKGDSDKLTQLIEDYYKVIIDDKYYKSYARASLDAGVPTTYLQKYVQRYGKKIKMADLRESYIPNEDSGTPCRLLGKEHKSVTSAGTELGVPTTWLYRVLALYGEGDKVDRLIENYGEFTRGHKVLIGDTVYDSFAEAGRKYGATESYVQQIMNQTEDPQEREKILEQCQLPIIKIGNVCVRTHTRIAKELDIPVKSVPDALKDFAKGMSVEKIQNKYRATVRKRYGPFNLYGVVVPSLLQISKVTGIRRGIIKELYDSNPDSESLEKALNKKGEQVYNDFYKCEGYKNKFEKLFREAFE